ncbi:unnamed protein product [Ophioblennius macclurei]
MSASVVLLLLSVSACCGDDGWHMKVEPEVRGREGYPVVLPCTFSHPQHSQHASLQVLWRLGHGRDGAVLFRCTSRPGTPGCEPEPRQDPRYRLEGDPREHDLSLRINGAALQDSGRYYCRAEVHGREGGFEDKMGTRLRVEAPPRILSVAVEGSEASGYRAVCLAQGSPLPDVQWLGADEPAEASSLGGEPLAQGAGARYQTASELRGVEPGQQYSCSASNPLGREQAALYVLPPRPPPPAPPGPGAASSPLLMLLLCLGAGAKLLLLLGVAVWGVGGGALQHLRCSWK